MYHDAIPPKWLERRYRRTVSFVDFSELVLASMLKIRQTMMVIVSLPGPLSRVGRRRSICTHAYYSAADYSQSCFVKRYIKSCFISTLQPVTVLDIATEETQSGNGNLFSMFPLEEKLTTAQ